MRSPLHGKRLQDDGRGGVGPLAKRSDDEHLLVLQFIAVPTPTDDARQSVLHKIITRMMKLLARRGVLVEEEGSTYMADNDDDSDEARTPSPVGDLHIEALPYWPLSPVVQPTASRYDGLPKPGSSWRS